MSTVTEPAANNTLTIDGIGPIAKPITFAYPDGGIVEFLGDHGAGKSTALRVINRMLGAEENVNVNDNAQKGRAEGFGVVLTVSKSTRKTGEASFAILDGKFSISDLADPQIDDSDAADRHRIKALVQLAKAKADPTLFNEILPPEEQSVILKPDTFKTDDLVTMAARIKRDLESAARSQENIAENLNSRARALVDSTEGVDVTKPHDPVALAKAHEDAIGELAGLRNAVTVHREMSKKAEKAREVLEELDSTYKGPTVDEANDLEVYAKVQQEQAAANLATIRENLRVAELAEQETRNNLAQAIANRKAAEQHFRQREEWAKAIDNGIPVCPKEDQLQTAYDAVERTRKEMEQGVVIRACKAKIAEATEINKKSAAASDEAKRYRESAKATDLVLSGVVSKVSSRLRVGTGRNSGRLVLTTDRGEELFAELSDGERAMEALHVAIAAVGRGGAIVIPQPYYDNLNRTTRDALNAELKSAGVVGFTATCVEEGELRARTLK